MLTLDIDRISGSRKQAAVAGVELATLDFSDTSRPRYTTILVFFIEATCIVFVVLAIRMQGIIV